MLNELFKEKETLRAKVSFDELFDVDFEFMDHRTHTKVLDECKIKMLSKGPNANVEYDNDKYWGTMSEKVLSWSLTYGILAELTGMILPENIKPDDIIPCNQENVLECMYELKGFSGFVVNTLTEIVHYREKASGEEKKISQPSAPSASV